MSLVFLGSTSFKRLGLTEILVRELSLLLLHFDFHVFTDVHFESYFELILKDISIGVFFPFTKTYLPTFFWTFSGLFWSLFHLATHFLTSSFAITNTARLTSLDAALIISGIEILASSLALK